MRLVRTICESQKAFKKLNENTALYFAKQSVKDGKINHHGAIVPEIEMVEDGRS